MRIISAIRSAARKHIWNPVVGRVLDRGLRWLCSQEGWENIVSASAQVLVDPLAAVAARAAVANVFARLGPYLSRDSIKVLRLVDEIARKNAPPSEAN